MEKRGLTKLIVDISGFMFHQTSQIEAYSNILKLSYIFRDIKHRNCSGESWRKSLGDGFGL
jgi:hypothetical protein